MRDTFARRLAELAGKDDRIIFITGDLGFGVFEQFQREFPSQYLNAGVAEQNMIALASGLALEGRIVFAYSIGNFPVLGCLEQTRNDAAYHDANVKVVSIGGGFSYGSLGVSHHATEDIAVMRAIPNVQAFTPGTLSDVVNSVDELVATGGTGYLRLDKSQGADTEGAGPFRSGAWRIMSEGSDVTLVACGGILGEAQGAARLLEAGGISARVVDATQVSGIGPEAVRRALGVAPMVVTMEEHVTRGGLAGLVAEVMATSAMPAVLRPRGIDGGFMSEVGSQAYLRTRVGLDAATTAAFVQAELGDWA